MTLEPTEELRVAGVRLLHPPEAEVTTDEVETRSMQVRTVRVQAPWITSQADPGLGAPYEVRIMIFEGEGPDTLPGTDSPRYRMMPGRIADREATLRIPVDSGKMGKAAFVRGERRFFFIEWRGPVEAVLETLELEG